MQEATSLAHSQMAETESRRKPKQDSVDKIKLPDNVFFEAEPPKLEVYNVLFKLVKKKKGRMYLDNCADNVQNPKKDNIPERIWLLNGAMSIWDSELEHIMKDKNRYERGRRGRDIIFIDGVCRMKNTDVLALEFMRANPHNVGKRRVGAGKFDFYEYNPQDEQKERHAKQLIKIEMINKASTMPIDAAKKLASYLGISFVDEIGQMKSDDGIRTELMIYADNAPDKFQASINSKEVEISYLVKKAIIDAKIDLGGQSQNITWSAGRGYICKLPLGRKAYEYLTELAMTNSNEGRQFKEQLESIAT